MLFFFSPLLFAHFLCLLCPAFGQGTGEKSLAETLYDLGTPLFSPIKEGETANLLARRIPFDDIKESISWTWDNTEPTDFLGVVVTNKGAWVFKIDLSYGKKLFPQNMALQASFIYEDDDFFNKIAYPLFGHADPRRAPPEPPVEVPSRSPYALSELSLDKKDYQKAFIISPRVKQTGNIANEPFVTALAWTITHNTGLPVQWAGQVARYKKRVPLRFILHRQPTFEVHGNQDLEIFDSDVSLLKATATSSTLDITHYDGFVHNSFPEMEDEKPNIITQLERLWNRYPDLTEELGYEKDRPKAARRGWNFDLHMVPKIFRHLNNNEQKISVIILVLTTQGFWYLTLSLPYLKDSGLWGISTEDVRSFRSEKPFLKLKRDVLEGSHLDSWQSTSEFFGCLGASLIHIVILSGTWDMAENRETPKLETAIKAILTEMMIISSSKESLSDDSNEELSHEVLSDEGSILYGLEKRQIPFFTFPLRTGRSKEARSHRFLLRHYTTPEVIDAQGKEYGTGEWFECYYGETAIIKGAFGPKLGNLEENFILLWSDKATGNITLSQNDASTSLAAIPKSGAP